MKLGIVLGWFSVLLILSTPLIVIRAGVGLNPLHTSVEPIRGVRFALDVEPTAYGDLSNESAASEYPPPPVLFISPALQTGTTQIGDTLNYSVMITSDPFWDIAGYDLQVNWNNTLLHLVGYSEGSFLQQAGAGTFSSWTVTVNSIEGIATKLSDPTPSGGTDSLMLLEFSVAFVGDSYPPPSCPLTLGPLDLVSWAHPERLDAPWNGSITAVDMFPFPGSTTIDAFYIAGYTSPGSNVDLYDQYPAPFGGQGPNQHSDSFAPQQEVCLYANVTYGGDRVTNRLVSFEIYDALGDEVTIRQNYSDISGVASVCFRIPQTDLNPGDEDPSIFGWWNAIATVELDQETVNDTMAFQVGWLAQATSIIAIGAPYLKFSSEMNFTSIIETIHEQPIQIVLSIDSYDSQGYPIGESAFLTTINASRVEGSPGNTTTGEYIAPNILQDIPVWARVDASSVIAYALTGFPRDGGTPWGPPSPAASFAITSG